MTVESTSALTGTARPWIIRMLRYLPLSLLAPRRATRELLQEQNQHLIAWSLIIAYCIVAAMLGAGFEWYEASKNSDAALFRLLGIEVSAATLIGYFVIFSTITFSAFMLSRFLWKQLFLYFDQNREVMSAMAMTAALGLLLDPILDGLSLLFDAGEAFGPRDGMVALYLLVSLVFGASYYSEALSIGWLRAFAIESAVLLIVLICIGIPLIIAMFIINPDLATEFVPEPQVEAGSQIHQWMSHEQV